MLQIKIKVSAIFLLLFGLTALHAQTVKDIDGNLYKTVTIGTQTWMAENLKTTKLNDGTHIPLSTIEGNEWAEHTVAGLTTPEFGWLYDSAAVYKDKYGAFYNGYAIATGKLCPAGWHVPSDKEWTTLITFLGGEAVAGGKLREPGTKHWNNPNNGATNETGFSARGGGGITDNGSNWSVGANTTFWSSTANDEGTLWARIIYANIPNVYRISADMHVGNPVRCVSDITGEVTKLKAPEKAVQEQSELQTIRNEQYRFEVAVPSNWSMRKGIKPDPDEEMKNSSPSFGMDSSDSQGDPDGWNGLASNSPFVTIFANEKPDQNPEEFAELFESTITRFRGTVDNIDRSFSVGDAKGFYCNYTLGLKSRFVALYQNGIRVIFYTIQFPQNDTTVYEKNDSEIEKVIQSLRIK